MSDLLVIDGITIRQDAKGRYSLNDLHRASIRNGANERTKEPGKFLSSPQTLADGRVDSCELQAIKAAERQVQTAAATVSRRVEGLVG